MLASTSTGFGASGKLVAPGGGRPATSPMGTLTNIANRLDPASQPRVGTAGRAFRPARSAASSSRQHGSWAASSLRLGPWSATGDRFTQVTPAASNPNGPRISEPLRLDPPTQWGAPPHRPPGASGRAKTPSTGARGLNKQQDFALLAQACRRAGRLKEEAVAQYCSGVLYDNAGQRGRAALRCRRARPSSTARPPPP